MLYAGIGFWSLNKLSKMEKFLMNSSYQQLPGVGPKNSEKSQLNLTSGVNFLKFFLPSLAWGGKNNAWYIYLTSRQLPPNLHNLMSAWPVMLLANKRLPYGNQILAQIMSLLKSILGKRKFLSTSMLRSRFLKKILNVSFFWWNTACWNCHTFI